jgi:hypothetical protein
MVLGLFLTAAACRMPSWDELTDSQWFEQREADTPRERSLRACRQEAEYFRASCAACHGVEEVSAVRGPESVLLTPLGARAQLMRRSPYFGLHQRCTLCHYTRFALNPYAQNLFSPDHRRTGGEQ